jgi:pyruvate,water dikinase
MGWFSRIFQKGGTASDYTLQSVRVKFSKFMDILENNNEVLKIISDMEEKSLGEYLFDINYIQSSLASVRSSVHEIAEAMITMGGEKYEPLRERYAIINAEISSLFPENRPVEEEDFAIPLENVGREKTWSVGSKSAQLGEMRSRLGLPVPEGFAISAWAYKYFVDQNDLQSRIADRITSVNITHFDDLVRISREIRSIVTSCEVPTTLVDAIQSQFAELKKRVPGSGFALRSSAVGEDTLSSFAGQYATFLNVRESELVDRYRDVLASKFTPQAIYYYLSHSFTESDLAMGVGCVSMVDAAASGVIHTRDPVQPEVDSLDIYAIYGLGKYLVDGTLAPDIYYVSRKDGRITETNVARKPVRLVLGRQGGTIQETVPENEQEKPVLNEEQVKVLAEFARQIEDHYGSPMDIEWAIDKAGNPYLLQARPLRIIAAKHSATMPDVSDLRVLCSGGVTVCPGAGSGPVFHLRSRDDLSRVPDGAVLVAPLPFPGLVTVLSKVHALVTHVGSTASHMATLAREYRIPTIVGMQSSWELEEETQVTVDASGRTVYEGLQSALIHGRHAEYNDIDDTGIFVLLKEVLGRIAPLNLVHPDDSDFIPENCRTFHDITRFVHQRAMEEMFRMGQKIRRRERVAIRLKSDIPLKVQILYIDQDLSRYGSEREVKEEDVASVPMKAFWDGIKKEGWPSAAPARGRRAISVVSKGLATKSVGDFSEQSFVVLGKEYMILSLRMGYHFTTVEAMCTEISGNNYVRFQCKGGGASFDRRSRRVQVYVGLLKSMGFECTRKGDFIDARMDYQEPAAIVKILHQLGRITVMTKQLDMALSNDNITQWYLNDFKKKLGLTEDSESPGND